VQVIQEPRLISETEDSHIIDTFLISTKPNEANWRINKQTGHQKVQSFLGTDFFIIPESIFSGEGQPGHPITGTVEEQLEQIKKNSHGKITKIKGPYPYEDGTDDYYYRANVTLSNSLAAATLIENGSKTWVPFAVSPQIAVIEGPDSDVRDWKAMGLGLVIKGAYGNEAVVHKYCSGSNHVCNKTLAAAIQDVVSSLVSNTDIVNHTMAQVVEVPQVSNTNQPAVQAEVSKAPVVEEIKKPEQITLTKEEFEASQKAIKEAEDLKAQVTALVNEQKTNTLSQIFSSVSDESNRKVLIDKYMGADVKILKQFSDDFITHVVPSLKSNEAKTEDTKKSKSAATELKPEPKKEESKSASVVPNSINEVKRFERLMREGY